VRDGRILLYSQRLGRRVIPRLSNAHNYRSSQLAAVYRFLCMMQHEGGLGVPHFSWGGLDTLEFVPRVRVGRVVLSLARWRLSKEEVGALTCVEGFRRFWAVQELRARRNLPRWVMLQENDNLLPVDFDNALSVDAFVHVLKRGSQGMLLEMYPGPGELCVTGPEGSFCHELDVPLIRRGQPPAPVEGSHSALAPAFAGMAAGRDVRVRAPGGDWLYAKLYGGSATLDHILTGAVAEVVRDATSSGAARSWFFLRYSDPDHHLRLRFHGHPERLRDEVFPRLSDAVQLLLCGGEIWKCQFDTYEREIERYGGLEGLLAAEEIFHADSDASLELLRLLDGDAGREFRWKAALLGIDALFNDFGFDDPQKLATAEQARDAFAREFRSGVAVKKQLGDRFRQERRGLEALLSLSPEVGAKLQASGRIFTARSARIAPIVQRFRSLADQGRLAVAFRELAINFAHLHVNRLVRSSPRLHEFALYDMLYRLYDGGIARLHRSAGQEKALVA